MKINKKNKIYIGVIAALLLLITLFGVSLIKTNQSADNSLTNDEIEVVDELALIEALISPEDREIIENYELNHGINDCYVGEIVFDSGIVDLPFVQGPDNDFFLRRDWASGESSVLGSIFMDYECTLDSQNIILYGHNAFSYYDAGVDENGNKLINDELMFTPLKFLINEEKYEDNKYVSLILKDEVRKYEIVSVFYCPLSGEGEQLYLEEGFEYYLPEYTDEYFEKYKNNIKKIEFYNTEVEYSNEDRFLTLQTCIEGNEMAREIVLCKEIDRHTLDRNAYNTYLEKMAEYNSKLSEIESSQEQVNSEIVEGNK